MEVQSQRSGQVTVSWTTSTAFTQMVTVPASSVAAGDCVTVSGSTSKKTKVVTAKTVTVSQPTTGKCTGGFGGPGGASGSATSGGFPGGGSGGPPSGGTFPGGGKAPSGGRFFGSGSGRRPAALANGGGFASGKVTTVTSSAMTVSGFSSASLSGSRPSSKGKTKRPSIKTTTVKVTITSSTTYRESQSAAASTLAVGDCVTAMGSSNSTGAVAASSVQISSTGAKSCTAGFFAVGGSGSANA
jgi:hypothetical protein